MISIYSTAPDPDSACLLCPPSLLELHPQATVWTTPPDITGLVSDKVAASILSGRWTPKSVMEMSALIYIAANGGIWISPEVYLMTSLEPLAAAIPFVGSLRGAVINSYTFGLQKNSPASAAALQAVQDLIDNTDDLKNAEADGSIITVFLERMVVKKALSVLPDQTFAVFGIPRFALNFIQSSSERRQIDLERMSGRLEGQTMFGVYAGKQGAIFRYRLRVDDEVRVPPELITPSSDPEIEASAGQMVTGFVGSMVTAGKNALTGKKIRASSEEVLRRSTICSGDEANGIPKCEFFNSTLGRCSKCGCWTRFKVQLEHEQCPEGKW